MNWTGIFDPKVWVAIVAVATNLLVLVNMPPEKKEQAIAFMVSVGALGAAFIGAKGYEKGKSNEGTVPEGAKAIPRQTIVFPPGAASYSGTITTPEQSGPGEPPPTRGPPSGIVRGWWLALLILPAVAFSGGGCTTTSYAFQKSVSATVPELADTYAAYVKADSVADAQTRTARFADASELKAAASAKAVTVERVDTAWGKVRDPYLAYVKTDPHNTPPMVEVFTSEASRLDALIAQEKERQSKSFLNLKPLTSSKK
jgi:hypothetical protein